MSIHIFLFFFVRCIQLVVDGDFLFLLADAAAFAVNPSPHRTRHSIQQIESAFVTRGSLC